MKILWITQNQILCKNEQTDAKHKRHLVNPLYKRWLFHVIFEPLKLTQRDINQDFFSAGSRNFHNKTNQNKTILKTRPLLELHHFSSHSMPFSVTSIVAVPCHHRRHHSTKRHATTDVDEETIRWQTSRKPPTATDHRDSTYHLCVGF